MTYFPNWPDYDHGTDADHLPIVPADIFPDDASHQEPHGKSKPVTGDTETYQGK